VTRSEGNSVHFRKVSLAPSLARILYVTASAVHCEYFGRGIFLTWISATGAPSGPLSLGPFSPSAPSRGLRPHGRPPRRRLRPSRLRSARGATCGRVEFPRSPTHVGRRSFAPTRPRR